MQALREREDVLRDALSPELQPPWVDVSGADPYRIVALEPPPGGVALVGLLRGSKALVTLAGDLRELGRVVMSEAPTALCASGAPPVAWVGSRYGRKLWRIALGARGEPRIALEQELSAPVADLACAEDGKVHVLPTDGSELLTLDAGGRVLARFPALPGGLRLARRGSLLLESSLFARTLRVLTLDGRGAVTRELARIEHDGTLWAFDAVARSGSSENQNELWLAVAGVENKPLVRAHGEFENIDSFVWLYRVDAGGAREVSALDVSDWGVVLPKALLLEPEASGLRLDVLAAGSDRRLIAHFDPSGAPQIETDAALPGASDATRLPGGRIVYATPLFDAWVELPLRAAPRVVRVDPERRPAPQARLGEALFFTSLMGPENSSLGSHSRFSCETCHFEGGVDGRTHYTGRADVSVVTKPLFGLAVNRPHFSRALDPDLSSVCHNEFRVAGAGSGTDPWFALESARFPWLRELGIDRARLEPLELRAALLEFLYTFSHGPNPNADGRSRFSSLEAEGARDFAAHCLSCHAARLRTDDASSAVPQAAWERLIFSRNAPIVWARPEYAKVGVRPYVHEQGTRIPSLRRLLLKPRYFTNGSSPDLASVLARFREGPSGGLHAAGTEPLAALDARSRAALLAFLQLL